MHDQETLAAGGLVDPFSVDLQLSLQHLRHYAQAGVMVARNVDEPAAGPLASQQGAHDLGVLRAPEWAARHTERVNDVADENDTFCVNTLEELVELARPGSLEPQVNV
jgi:hypothetical protein